MPSWFLDNRPMDPHHIFAAATATAPRLQLASSKAASQARGDIAAEIETRFQGLTKQFQEEVGQGPGAEEASQFTQAYQTTISQTINGSEVVKREIKREGGEYRACVLMRMPIGQAQEKLMAQIEANPEQFTRFRSSQAFEELEQEIHGHRQREKEQRARRQGQTAAQEGGGQVREREAETVGDRGMGRKPDGTAVQAERQTTGEVTEREAEAGANPDLGPQPDADAVQAPENDGGGAPESEVQAIEARVRSVAEPWMGVPYEFGGETKNGVDCSALVQALYGDAFNVDLPQTTGKQVTQGTAISASEMRAGDLVFFRTSDQQKHVGVYLDDGKFVHASLNQGVTISPMRYDYWQDNYWTARRFNVI